MRRVVAPQASNLGLDGEFGPGGETCCYCPAWLRKVSQEVTVQTSLVCVGEGETGPGSHILPRAIRHPCYSFEMRPGGHTRTFGANNLVPTGRPQVNGASCQGTVAPWLLPLPSSFNPLVCRGEGPSKKAVEPKVGWLLRSQGVWDISTPPTTLGQAAWHRNCLRSGLTLTFSKG
ncbi:hypothetical protein L209DRAFT_241691 [Thermothelomyces heterothallicus CBS 203.75]